MDQDIHLFESTWKQVCSTKSGIPSEIFCYEAMVEASDSIADIDPLLAFKTTSDLDTLYYHQAMRQPDREYFKLTMDKEIKDQMNNGNFTVMHRTNLPANTQVLPMV